MSVWPAEDAQKERSEVKQVRLVDTLHPLLLVLRCLGATVPLVDEQVQYRRVSKVWSLLNHTFSTLYIVRHVVFICVDLPYEEWSKYWSLHGIFFFWYSLVYTGSVVFLYQTWNSDSSLNSSLHVMDEYDQEFQPCDQDKERRLVKIATVILVMVNAGLSIFMVAISYLPANRQAFKLIIWPFDNIYGIVFVIPIMNMSAITFFSVLVPSTLCVILRRRFDRLNADAKEAMKWSTCDAEMIEHIRRRFGLLVVSVGALDRFIGKLIGIVFTVFIPMACFNLYRFITAITTHGLAAEISLMAFFLIGDVGMMGILLTLAASVHESAHGLKFVLYRAVRAGGEQQYWTNSQKVELIMLMDELNGGEIGVSIFGLFVVTKDTTLTIVSVYLTYFVLTLQVL